MLLNRSPVIAVGLSVAVRHQSSVFQSQMPTSAPPQGPPRGEINRLVGVGLPPWAAWTVKMDQSALYRMAQSKPTSFLPRRSHELDAIWGNERARYRTRSSLTFHNVYQQIQYPYFVTGCWHSDALDHWVQVPHVKAVGYDIERAGGFDNYITSRSGSELRSKFAERIRRHILVRQNEITKNYTLEKHAQHLSKRIVEELKVASTKEQVQGVCAKYSLSPVFYAKLQERFPALAPRPTEEEGAEA